ncbi:MAG TPA: winged helix-turn-helix domain-containing protein [Nitrososphaera sp.]|jgi:predicted transcriptional regulator
MYAGTPITVLFNYIKVPRIVMLEGDERTKTMHQILKACRNGATKVELARRLGLSRSLLRKMTAELTDKGFLLHIGSGLYMTTDDGYKFIAESSSTQPGQGIQTMKEQVKKSGLKPDTMSADRGKSKRGRQAIGS